MIPMYVGAQVPIQGRDQHGQFNLDTLIRRANPQPFYGGARQPVTSQGGAFVPRELGFSRRSPSIPVGAAQGLANDPGWRQFAAGPDAYGAAPPVQRDIFAARDLGQVAAGVDMRFGQNSPASMFRGPTVQSAPGQYTVHPMMPSRGGPMPMPAADLGTSQYDRNMGAMQWARQHQSPGDGSVASVLGMRPGGDVAVRVQGFPKQANGMGPGYAYAPAGQIAGAFNKLAANNPGLGLSPFNVDGGGVPMSADGRTPMNAADLHSAMVQARRDRGQQKIEMLRDNMRGRLAIRAAQRGNLGPLAKLMQARGDQQAGAAGDGVDHNAIFGMAANMIQGMDDKTPAAQKTKLMAGLVSAMLSGKAGAAQIPGLFQDVGNAQAGQRRAELAKDQGVRMPAQNPVDWLSILYNDWTGVTQRNQNNVRRGMPIEDPFGPPPAGSTPFNSGNAWRGAYGGR